MRSAAAGPVLRLAGDPPPAAQLLYPNSGGFSAAREPPPAAQRFNPNPAARQLPLAAQRPLAGDPPPAAQLLYR